MCVCVCFSLRVVSHRVCDGDAFPCIIVGVLALYLVCHAVCGYLFFARSNWAIYLDRGCCVLRACLCLRHAELVFFMCIVQPRSIAHGQPIKSPWKATWTRSTSGLLVWQAVCGPCVSNVCFCLQRCLPAGATLDTLAVNHVYRHRLIHRFNTD